MGGGSDEGDDEYERERRTKNKFGFTNTFWASWHAALIFADGWALWRMFQDHSLQGQALLTQGKVERFSTSSLFGAHSQYIALWSLVLSVTSHAATFWAMVSEEPFPEKYVHRDRMRKDRVYHASSRLSGLATCFCTAACMCSLVLIASEEEEWGWGGGHSRTRGFFPYLYADTIVPLEKWVCLVLQIPRHWSCGPGRFISRKSRYMELDVGQSSVHSVLWGYLAWLATCRVVNGVWAYSTLARLERTAGTGLNHIIQLFGVTASVQLAAWLCWWCASKVVPKPRL